jgi:prepilin-type N-terminal cleavage/methylation domain-containing protein
VKFVVKNAVPAVTIAAKKRAFSLVEMLIVISILGIMAAIVIPMLKDHSQKAKEAAAKDNLRVLRTAIEAYAARNNGVPPGYAGDDPTGIPAGAIVVLQLTPGYMKSIPVNPLTDLDTVRTIPNGPDTLDPPSDAFGWVYKPETKTIKLDSSGTDSEGIAYFDY